MSSYIKLDQKDNVLVALIDIAKDSMIEFEGQSFLTNENVKAKHKIFLNDMLQGEEIIMYGVLVGKAQYNIAQGDAMTTANTVHAADPYSYRGYDYSWVSPNVDKFKNRTFNGYVRSDGRAGTANYWLFMPTVFCENRNLDVIKEALHNELGYAVTDKYKRKTRSLVKLYQDGKDLENDPLEVKEDEFTVDRVFSNVDGIKFLNHQGGCGGTRQDAAVLSSLLAAYADHPNVAGVTILSLGCQNLEVPHLLADIKQRNPDFDKPLLVFEQQTAQSEEELITEAIRKTFLGLVEINKIQRQPCLLEKLTVGVKCGGSDGFSGISANPAVGFTSDLLIALGAKVLLAEFPELCGAEQGLLDRIADETKARKFIKLMSEYDALAHAVGSGFHMNPSPGNIKDGLITDAIKSAGAAKKGGTAPVTDVLNYTEAAVTPGLNLVCTPGNDVEATTGKAAAGATLILFTSGLGTPTGNPVCPTIKISTNSSLAVRMTDIIDFDAGPIITGEKTVAQVGEEILELCIAAASGTYIPKAVRLNQDDFIPWKRGVSL